MTRTRADALIELAERVEALEGPERDTDWRIQKALGIGHWPDVDMWPPFMKGSARDKEIPNYTASIDAAMTLAPDGSFRRLSVPMEGEDGGPFIAALVVIDDDGDEMPVFGNGATPALALTAASLRALAQEVEG